MCRHSAKDICGGIAYARHAMAEKRRECMCVGSVWKAAVIVTFLRKFSQIAAPVLE